MDPIIVLATDDDLKDTAQRLLAALRDFHGQPARIFVRDHVPLGETVVALLPPGGPSLAAALRDWVAEWWSDGDEDPYGSPAIYLDGLGITIPSEDATFSTSCPYCGTDSDLTLASGTFTTTGVSITPDGFALADVKQLDTENEQVVCGACARQFPLQEILL